MSDYIITCNSCGSSNRVQADKEGQTGRCGNCHAVLAPLYLHTQQLTANTFDNFISTYPGPVLAEFWAPW